MNTCPCCGQSVDTGDLLVSLDSNTASRNGVTVLLTPTQVDIVQALLAALPGNVAHERFTRILWGERTRGPSDPKLVVRVEISHMRKRLADLGVSIVPVYGEGYRMVVE